MVTFDRVKVIVFMVTQGRSDADQWVTRYRLETSEDGQYWGSAVSKVQLT